MRTTPSTGVVRRGRLLIVLGGLSAVAPLGTDMYVPGLADLARDLQAAPWAIGLSPTGFHVDRPDEHLRRRADPRDRRGIVLAAPPAVSVSPGSSCP